MSFRDEQNFINESPCTLLAANDLTQFGSRRVQ